ncbi:MAG: hypothetical protein GY940_25530, partial [bacterium]|nr:hypothetical protein [bacterium]
KPFGAIATPTQGGTASGGGSINWGWVLTPRPNTIPTDGSTIDVWVDGVNLGHPVYNIFREDIASLFPSYANSGGAVGYFQLDTTAYEDGVHTIQWTAADNVGNTDGIGSRYFTIQNGESRGARNSTNNFDCTDAGGVPMEYSAPVGIRTGYDRTVEPFPIYPDVNGIIDIRIKELEPLEIHFSAETGNRTPLPVGSTLDTEKGIFYWQPGPGFIGRYPFTFIKRENSGEMTRVHLLITIMPKF